MAAQFLVLTHAASLPDDAVAQGREYLQALGYRPQAARRLSPGGVEIGFSAGEPVARPAIAGVDANIVPASFRQKKLLVADMDSTIIAVECIDELADFAGVKDRVAAITERAMRGEIDFEAAIHERVGLLAGLPELALETCFRERVRLNPGAVELVATMNAYGAITALVSGGFTFFTTRVAAQTGFAMNRANILLTADGRLTGKVALPVLGEQAKRDALVGLRGEHNLHRDETLAVGDGANDLAMIAEAGLGVAFHAKPALRAAAGAVLDHSGLTALLALQGYALGRDGKWALSPTP